MNFYKVGMCFVNLMALMLASITLLTGYATTIKLDEIEKMTKDLPVQLPSMLLFCLGFSIIILILTVGCVGTLTENDTLLFIYSFVFLILILIQICIACFAVFHVDNVTTHVVKYLRTNFEGTLSKDNTSTKIFFDIESKFKCCGLTGPSNYRYAVPKSCCSGKIEDCTMHSASKIGCMPFMVMYLHNITETISSVCLVDGVLNFFAAVYIGFFADKMKNDGSISNDMIFWHR